MTNDFLAEPANSDDRMAAISNALGNLVAQIDIAEYRDARGHNLHNNIAFQQAQALVERFGLTHERICKALDDTDGDAQRAAAQLAA